MKIWLSIILLIGYIYAQSIDKKWATSDNCKACHTNITSKWETSRHANSHYSKNDLFKKSLDYIVKKNPSKILDEVKLECAKCHNPRVGYSKVDEDDKIAILFDDKNTTKNYHKVLNSATVKNGINCIVCHNIDKINLHKDKGSQGMQNVYFGKQGVMFGPFEDAHSPYHKTEHRKHFQGDNPKLCFACHYSAKNEQNVMVYATGLEYDDIKRRAKAKIPGCKSCHMSDRKQGYASNYAPEGQKPKSRMVRVHRFASVDNSDILKDYISIKDKVDINNSKFIIKVQNKTPHKLPTGYGLREVILKVEFLNTSHEVLDSVNYIFGSVYVDKSNQPTIPHLASKVAMDTRLGAYSQRKLKFNIPKKTRYIKYTLTYKLIGDKLAHQIGVSDKFFLKDYLFFEKNIEI